LEVIKEKGPCPGQIYRPNDDKSYPAIIFLHGSEGGNGDFWKYPGFNSEMTGENSFVSQFAKSFAEQGFVTYALSYFHSSQEGDFECTVPSELKDVDIEDITYRAFSWLKKSKYVLDEKVGLFGVSRGAEQALLLASITSQNEKLDSPSFIVALSPPDLVATGFLKEYAEATSRGEEPDWKETNAWRFGDYIPKHSLPIEVDKIDSPTLITYGALDEVWGKYVQPFNIVKRLRKFNISHEYLEFKNTDDVDKSFLLTTGQDKKHTIVNFLDEGHGGCEGTRSSELKKKLYNWLIQKT
jgi:dipeptidyl aminopeptidase/acylaminoacyl peptidase